MTWKVYEDLSKRDGSITFVPARGAARVMTKRLEAVFSQAAVPFLGLSQQDIAARCPTCWRTNCWPAAAIPMRSRFAMPLP